jgi:hypothetical protein
MSVKQANEFEDREAQAVWELLGQAPDIQPSFGFVERTLRRWHAEPARPVCWPVWRWAAALGLVTVLGVAGVFVQRTLTTRQAIVVYAHATTDQLEDFDVIAVLHQLEGEQNL